ncbi:hypothetical protein CBL_09299 [Carabus blaptoides fortunei]
MTFPPIHCPVPTRRLTSTDLARAPSPVDRKYESERKDGWPTPADELYAFPRILRIAHSDHATALVYYTLYVINVAGSCPASYCVMYKYIGYCLPPGNINDTGASYPHAFGYCIRLSGRSVIAACCFTDLVLTSRGGLFSARGPPLSCTRASRSQPHRGNAAGAREHRTSPFHQQASAQHTPS